MIQRKKKICKECGKEKYLFSSGYCLICFNKLRNRERKQSYKPKRGLSRSQSTNIPQRSKKLSQHDIERRRIMQSLICDANSQPELFNMVWQEALASGRVRCFISDKDITHFRPGVHERWMWCCAHVLSKGQYSKWKLKKDNIRLLHPDVHYMVDNWEEKYREKYTDHDFDKWFELQDEFKKQYNK